MSAPAPSSAEPVWVGVVREKVESLRFGVVQIVVHDGRVTLIERTEKTKLDESAPPSRARTLLAREQTLSPTGSPEAAPKRHAQ